MKGTVDTGNDRNSLPALLDSLYPKHLSQKLSEISTLYLRPPVCRII